MTRHRSAVIASVIAAATTSPSCFTGSAALGLPCERDEDCGTEHACVQGVCGGPSVATEGGSDSTSADTGSSGAGGGSTTADASSGSSEGSESGGTGPVCGNGTVEAPEACDERGETATCDADCTFVECGDETTNVAAGECEPAGETVFGPCSPWCRPPIFWDDMENVGRSEALWNEPENPTLQNEGPPPVDVSLPQAHRWQLGNGAWRSGDYACASGETRFDMAEAVLVPVPRAGFHVELRLRHRFAFDPQIGERFPDCQDDPQTWRTDGGRVQVLRRAPAEPANLIDLYDGGTILASDGLCAGLGPIEPWYPLPGAPGFVGTTGPDLVEVGTSLEVFEDDEIRLRFSMVYGCRNCGYDCVTSEEPPDEYGWVLHDVAIVEVPDR